LVFYAQAVQSEARKGEFAENSEEFNNNLIKNAPKVSPQTESKARFVY